MPSTTSKQQDNLSTLSPDDCNQINTRLQKTSFNMLQQGIIRPLKSAWSSLLHMVQKSDAISWRPCGDFRRLNAKTVLNRYSIPHIHDFAIGLQGATLFSKLNLVKAYYQVPVAEEGIHKTALTTPFGFYEFVWMPFGLRNACQTFPRLIDEALDFMSLYR